MAHQIKLEIPYFSQHRDIADEAARRESCAIACLAMVIKHHAPDEDASPDSLLAEATAIAPKTARGWSHDLLMWVAHNHGVQGYHEEFKSFDPHNLKMVNEKVVANFTHAGIEKIRDSVDGNLPVIVSVIRNFNEPDHFHEVVITGYEEKGGALTGFFYSDPDRPTEKEGQNLFVSLDIFMKTWRKMALFLYPNML
jgi:hypothetical protein